MKLLSLAAAFRSKNFWTILYLLSLLGVIDSLNWRLTDDICFSSLRSMLSINSGLYLLEPIFLGFSKSFYWGGLNVFSLIDRSRLVSFMFGIFGFSVIALPFVSISISLSKISFGFLSLFFFLLKRSFIFFNGLLDFMAGRLTRYGIFIWPPEKRTLSTLRYWSLYLCLTPGLAPPTLYPTEFGS